MTVTVKELMEIRLQVSNDMESLEHYKKRGKGRYVPENDRVTYTTLLYTRWIINWLISKMKKGNVSYHRKCLIEMLLNQNWNALSHSGRVYSGAQLKEILNDNGKDTLLRYAYQTVYLERASRYLTELLAVSPDEVGSYNHNIK